MSAKPSILLSFDVEEFDMPLEYKQSISLAEQMHVGLAGLEALIPIWNKFKTPTTLFTTAHFAQQYPDIIRSLSSQHEIASHTFYHSQFETSHLLKSKIALESITGKPVYGLRMPRMKKIDLGDVMKAGYSYDSSINPTWLPGRYNNLSYPRTSHTKNGLTILPASVSPSFRLPLFWLAFKNYPYKMFLHLCKRTLKTDGYLCLYFHPWEFTDLKKYHIPGYAKRIDGKSLLNRLDQLMNDLSEFGEFNTIHDFLKDNINPTALDGQIL